MMQKKGIVVTLEIDPSAYPTETLFDILNALPMPVFVYQPDGEAQLPVFMNQRCLDMLEADSLRDAIAFCDGCFSNYVVPEERELVKSKDRRAIDNVGKTLSYEYHITTERNRQRLIRVLSIACIDSDGNLMVVNLTVGLGARPDVEETDALDPVTGLISMQAFFQVMARWRRKYDSEQDGSELVVLYLDVLNFRLINANRGISAGDAFLKSIGDCLRALFPANPISRFDVDHFAVLAHSDNIKAKADSICEMVGEFAPAGVGINIGACVWDNHALSAESVCRRAKAACDDSRKHVNTFFSVYDEKMGKNLESTEYIVSHIDEAIQKRWIRVFCQPIVRSVSGSICGVEALARWEDPERGMLAPNAFIKPLEDSQQIWKLDLCVIEQAIAQVADRSRRGLSLIPVSVSLSRTDFLSCDIYEKVESLVREYGIPRSMLHIEVTESAIAAQEDAVIQTLNRFRQAGYEVWMDDFGSGYSSLNLLKDYDFDVLKLDMAFLHKDTERSRNIISSVVSMDKRVGIRTLAEGVETEGQAEFLRSIGCAKMQGYYFGKPLPFDEMLAECLDKGMSIEDARQRAYFEGVAYIDFLTDNALVIFDYWDGNFHILQYNEHAPHMMQWYGAEGPKEFEDAVNTWNSSSNNALATAMRYAVQTGKAGEQTISFGGKEMLFRFRSIGQMDGHLLIVANYYDISKRMTQLANLAMATSSILEFYRNVFYLDIESQSIQSLRFGNNLSGTDELGMVPIQDERGDYAPLLPRIFDVDAARYRAFLDVSTLKERLEQADGELLRDVFRTVDVNGGYQWMEHMLVFEHGSSRSRVLYGIRPLNIKDLSKEIELVQNDSYAEQFEHSQDAGNILWCCLMPYLPLKLFWKDRERRFLGASKAFLDYYGFDSVSEILGKTDDDLNWHPDEEGYRDAELDVLNHGTVSRDVHGRCIKGGIGRNIVATKWPIYQNGEIVGLMGYFREEADVKSARAGGSPADSSPRQKHLRRIEQFIEDFLAFETDYGINQRAFGLIHLVIPEVSRVAVQYGPDAKNLLEGACEREILTRVGQEASAVNLGAGRYGIICKYRSRDELKEVAKHLEEGIESICKLQEYRFSPTADISIAYVEDLSAWLKKLTESLFEGAIDGDAETDEESWRREEAVQQLMDSAPFGCYVLKPDRSVVYWNPEAKRLLGYTPEDMLGKRCFGSPLGCAHVSGEMISSDQCPAVFALATGKPKTMQMFMRRRDGSDLLVRNTIVPMRDSAGKITFLVSFFEPLADESYGHGFLKQIYEVATRDPVTCLPGRKYMETCIRDSLELFHRTGRVFAVLFADIDGLHGLNNSFGHRVGDKVLRSFGSALLKYGRKTDVFCRWGGDEFVGLLQLKDAEDVKGAACRFQEIVRSVRVEEDGHDIHCQASIGITVVREGDDAKTVVDRADRYMYQAKEGHGDSVVTDFSAGIES